MTMRDLLLLICFIGGFAGAAVGAARRDVGTSMLGFIVVAISAVGMFG